MEFLDSVKLSSLVGFSVRLAIRSVYSLSYVGLLTCNRTRGPVYQDNSLGEVGCQNRGHPLLWQLWICLLNFLERPSSSQEDIYTRSHHQGDGIQVLAFSWPLSNYTKSDSWDIVSRSMTQYQLDTGMVTHIRSFDRFWTSKTELLDYWRYVPRSRMWEWEYIYFLSGYKVKQCWKRNWVKERGVAGLC